jgi:hypothetical protein
MRNTLSLGLGCLGLVMVGGCALPQDGEGGEDGERAADTPASSADEAGDRAGDWHFVYEEPRQEVTARRGVAVLVYRLRDLGVEGATLMASFKGYDGATWTLPNDDTTQSEGAEELGSTHDPLVIIGYPPPFTTPTYTTPGYPPPKGMPSGGKHGPPPGWNSATWNKACQIAAAMAAYLGCAAVSADCAADTVLTLGGTAVPCALVVGLACTVGAGAGASLAMSCPK